MLPLAIAGTAVTVTAVVIPTCLRRMRAPAASAVTRGGRYAASVEEAASALVAGQLVAFPTETVYGLGAHAFDTAAVCRIFEVKGRPRTDPIICHVPTLEAAERLVRLQPDGLALLRLLSAQFWPGPLTIVAPACAELPEEITSGTGFVGVRCVCGPAPPTSDHTRGPRRLRARDRTCYSLARAALATSVQPSHKLALELLKAAGVPVAAPSANRFGHVSPTLRARDGQADLRPISARARADLAWPWAQVSPTRAEHVMADLGAHDIWVLRGQPGEACCEVGIESTVS